MFDKRIAWLALFVTIWTATDVRAAERRPNIIFILADDLGYGDLGCYGQRKIKTPNLDRMADDGVRFTDCYAGNAVCAPSRCCLMTGRHPGHARIRGNHPYGLLGPGDVTVAEVLKQVGYATGQIGKWDLAGPGSAGVPIKKGFDVSFGYLEQYMTHTHYPPHLFRGTDKVPLAGNPPTTEAEMRRFRGKDLRPRGDKGQYAHDLLAREALEFLGRHKDRPFFLYLAYLLPHGALEVPHDAPYSAEAWPQAEKNYAAMVTRLDRDVGRLCARLKELGLEKDTIVFFASDNGAMYDAWGHQARFFGSAGPFRGFKGELYEGGIRVPMLVCWPGKIKGGSVSHEPWALWDFLPTAAELAGAKVPAGTDGISVLPALLGRKQKPHDFLYWEFREKAVFRQALRMGRWKTVCTGEHLELYDLTDDPGEKADVAAKQPEVVAKVRAALKIARVPSKEWPSPLDGK